MAGLSKGVFKELVSDYTTKTQLRTFTFGELMAAPDPEFLVDGLLVEGTVSLLTGKHASYKSFFALDIALSVATGKNAFNLTTQPGTALYIAAEGVGGFRRRVTAWIDYHGIACTPNIHFVGEPVQIANPAAMQELIAYAATFNPKLIVIDTLARCADGLDENNAAEMGKFINAAGQISLQLNTHVLIVHHNNKGGSERGSTALPAAVETHLSISKTENHVTITTEKQKDADEAPPLTLAATPHQPSLVLITAQTSTEQQALDALTDEMLAAKWEQASRLKPATFHRVKDRLIQKGKVVQIGEKGSKSVAFKPA